MLELLQDYLLWALVTVYFIAGMLYLGRLFKGVDVPSMVILVDSLTYDVAVLILVIAIYTRNAFLAIIALPLSLWAYALDIYVSKYLEGREFGD
ncbi:MAG: hypothetical protein B7O98_05820 [Zestosphaera tikiterensis]|uniref:PH regulation protein F n=1 Tax=Zestosphaera tikiterensis TaxID=1973259 RepID=A0A2R7Y478_9CREN|nr:MAG: hypothetical protein B7O98_05820 [Zestosphaera tikiterensis]